jgi:hypothetical protein
MNPPKPSHWIIAVANDLGYHLPADQATAIGLRAEELYVRHFKDKGPPRGGPADDVFRRAFRQALEELMGKRKR